MQGKVMLETGAQAPVYVGVDVCKERLDIYLHPLGKQMCVVNGPEGYRRLKRALGKHEVALVIMEATSKYHRPAQRSLAQAGFAVAVVNPLRARLFAKAAGALAKTDRVDAKMLAVLGQALGPRAEPPAPRALEELQELVRTRSGAIDERTALANRLSASQGAFVRAELRRRLKSLDVHIKRLNAEIDRRIGGDPALARRYEILLSIPGLGPVAAATLLADLSELGSCDRRAIASLAGLAPVPDDSGDRTGQRHIKGGRIHVRNALYMAALSAARYNPDLARFHKHLTQKGKKPKVVLTALMRKLVILANTLISENRLWVPKEA